jgi:hypothetical protein
MSQPNTSEPTGVGAEVADEAAEVSAGAAGAPGAAERAGEPRDPDGATSDTPADDAGGGDVTGGTAAASRDGKELPGVATGTAGGNGIGDSGERSTSGPVDTGDTGTR